MSSCGVSESKSSSYSNVGLNEKHKVLISATIEHLQTDYLSTSSNNDFPVSPSSRLSSE